MFVSRPIAHRLTVRSLNDPDDWGPSDHCRIMIDLQSHSPLNRGQRRPIRDARGQGQETRPFRLGGTKRTHYELSAGRSRRPAPWNWSILNVRMWGT